MVISLRILLFLFYHNGARLLSNLPTSKPIEDWVQDAVLHPLTSNYIFDAEDVIDSIKQPKGNRGVIIGSSPRFFQDFRRFKSLSVTFDSTNTIFVNQFGGAVGLVDTYNLDRVSREGSTNDKALSTGVSR